MRIVPCNESLAAAEQAQLGVGIEAAVANPAAKKKILARKLISADGVGVGDGGANFFGQLGTDVLIGVEQQNPILGAKINGKLFLSDITTPRLDDDAGSVCARNLAGAVVEPESTTTISSAHLTPSRVRPRLASSFRLTIATESVMRIFRVI